MRDRDSCVRVIFDFYASSIMTSYRLGQGRTSLQLDILVFKRCESRGSSLMMYIVAMYRRLLYPSSFTGGNYAEFFK